VTDRAPRVGFIGLGDQGAPIARRIIDAGYRTTLWARRRATVDPFADTSARIAATPMALGADSDIVGICVRADDDVVDVVAGPEGVLHGMTDGGVIMVHSTTDPDTCRRLAAHASDSGVSLIDAPVSGGGQRAAERALLVMVGGDRETLERCRPVIETYGQPVIHLGPVGSGQSAKLMNNLLFTAHLALGTRTFALARALDIEPSALARVLEAGSGASAAIGVLAGTGYTAAGVVSRAGPLLRKDTQLAVDLARSVGVTMGILADAADDALATMGHRRDAPE